MPKRHAERRPLKGVRRRRALKALQEKLGIDFTDTSLLEQALTHRSSLERRVAAEDNERLEFLGDAVLQLAVTDLLYGASKDPSEGRLTQIRARLVRGETLARIARRLGVPDLVKLGRGEASTGGAEKDSINANVFEALLGAIFLETCYEETYRVVKRLFRERIRRALRMPVVKDVKSRLQEISLGRSGRLPLYEHLEESGEDHCRRYVVRVSLSEDLSSRGTGTSKKAAEKAAARALLKKLAGDSVEETRERARSPSGKAQRKRTRRGTSAKK